MDQEIVGFDFPERSPQELLTELDEVILALDSTHMNDQLLLAMARQLAGWAKRPGERDCYARFMKEWLHN